MNNIDNNKKRTIKSFDELLDWLYNNWDYVSDEEFRTICHKVLAVYVHSKGDSRDEALNQMLKFYNRWIYTPITDRPLFLENYL